MQQRHSRVQERDRIVSLLRDHPDMEYSTDSIARAIGQPDRSVLNSVMNRLVQNGQVKRARRGAYYWTDKRDTSQNDLAEHDLLEVLRVRQDGDLVIVDAYGGLYVAKKLDV